ncbi:hypothetical protein Trad_2058 [Truepera radiovictrix DSM 17093]|uniref:Uncharacterized protein n=1 Tax=Truepera radiovictrix (strain DSM 17093 / CIP 108686 / LMG 22925 / RQ-24) TaxID=649638 RepID=D7CR84_TRURR|nr:hypothetical protein Trad_2058 [Truepera radiovictrix DSM 17093]
MVRGLVVRADDATLGGVVLSCLLLLSACTPVAQPARGATSTTPPETAAHPVAHPVDAGATALVGSGLTVPDTGVTLQVGEALLRGERIAFELPGDRGTLQLLAPGLEVRAQGRDFLVLPLEVRRVSGAGGLYVTLVEVGPERVAQRGSQALGRGLRLLSLTASDGLITVQTVDARLGRPPAMTPRGGGTVRFRIVGGRLVRQP